MQARECAATGHDSDTADSDPDPDYNLKCMSCGEDYDSGACKECYEEASDTKQDLKELKAKVAFLSFRSPSDQHSDVLLVTSAQGSSVPLPAHKAVLASRSPVFKAMFKNEMEESISGTIKINDVTYSALHSFINYLYTAEACLDEQIAREVLVLADKYDVKHLKTYCDKFLVSKLNWDNSVTSYAFAHQYRAKHLLGSALSLIIDNMDKLAKQGNYKELIKEDAKLVVKIYEAYMRKQVNKGAPKEPYNQVES